MTAFVHETAVLDDGAKVGKGTKIWHFVHISGGARVGQNCSLGQNVYVGNNVTIGNGVRIQNNVSVFDNVFIEDDVFCGPSMVFTNVVNPRAFVARKDEYRDTFVRRGASLGANCTIVCGAEIGEFALVGAGAVVTKNVKPYALVVGNPARQVGWMSEYGDRLDLALAGNGTARCPNTGTEYKLTGETVRKL